MGILSAKNPWLPRNNISLDGAWPILPGLLRVVAGLGRGCHKGGKWESWPCFSPLPCWRVSGMPITMTCFDMGIGLGYFILEFADPILHS